MPAAWGLWGRRRAGAAPLWPRPDAPRGRGGADLEARNDGECHRLGCHAGVQVDEGKALPARQARQGVGRRVPEGGCRPAAPARGGHSLWPGGLGNDERPGELANVDAVDGLRRVGIALHTDVGALGSVDCILGCRQAARWGSPLLTGLEALTMRLMSAAGPVMSALPARRRRGTDQSTCGSKLRPPSLESLAVEPRDPPMPTRYSSEQRTLPWSAASIATTKMRRINLAISAGLRSWAFDAAPRRWQRGSRRTGAARAGMARGLRAERAAARTRGQ